MPRSRGRFIRPSGGKTAGVLGDDLALNAQQVAAVKAHRELPVAWSVFKGSLVNKLILVPAALLISWLAPVLVVPLMMVGGAYLCYEGFEKVVHKLFHREAKPDPEARAKAVLDSGETPQELEKKKIRGAVRTDFILSAEIIVLSLAVVAAEPLRTRATTLAVIALGVTIGVYGLVAAIVKMDDAGLWMARKQDGLVPALGRGLVYAAPWLMKVLESWDHRDVLVAGDLRRTTSMPAPRAAVLERAGVPAFIADTLRAWGGRGVGALALARSPWSESCAARPPRSRH